MPRLQLQTGDVTRSPLHLRIFEMEAGRPLAQVILSFDGRTAQVAAALWPTLLEQVRIRSLSHWKHARMAPPMGQSDMQELLSVVGNTPAYQLFLAGFDFAEAVGLVRELPERIVLRRAIALTERLPSVLGTKGLFVLPDSLLDEDVEREVLEELVRNNKLCRLHVDSGEQLEKYYIPYATPIGFATPVSERAKQLWDRVRDYFYAYR